LSLEITPEPSPEEREALLRVLAAEDGATAPPSPWWAAGIREALEDGPDEG
jgi:hypothetical protein